MNEHQILMSDPDVRATLEGRKVEARRPVAGLDPDLVDNVVKMPILGWCQPYASRDGKYATNMHCPLRSPFGVPGDRLWVKEAWAQDYRAPYIDDAILYRATDGEVSPDKWTPSIHMPRWSSRLLLEVEDVRCERLQDIDEESAVREGHEADAQSARMGFYGAWLHRYGIAGNWKSWNSNPWVWVVQWRVVATKRGSK